MSAMASRVNNVSMVCSTVCSGTDQRKHQCSALMAFVRGIPLTKGQLCGKCFRLMTSSCSFCWSVIRGAQWSTLDSYYKWPVMRCFLNKMVNRQSNDRWLEMPWRSCDVTTRYECILRSNLCRTRYISLQNTHKRHTIALPCGRNKSCPLGVYNLGPVSI